MRSLRIVCFLTALLMILVSCHGQGGGEAQETEPVETDILYDFLNFEIVRADQPTAKTMQAVKSLNRTIEAHMGQTLPVKTDFSGDPESACEILIGSVDRAEAKTLAATLSEHEYIIQTVKTANGMKLVVLGYDEDTMVTAVSELQKMLQSGSVVDTAGKLKPLDIKIDLLDLYQSFRIELGEPTVVAQSDSAVEESGHYQFPSIFYLANGNILARWGMHNDKLGEVGATACAVSSDGGRTWVHSEGNGPRIFDDAKCLMSNGKYFVSFIGQSAHQVDYMGKYTPLISNATAKTNIYFAKDIAEYQVELQGLEYDPATGVTTSFPITLNWPYATVSLTNGNILTTVEANMQVGNYVGMISTDSGLYYCTYARGVNSKTGKSDLYSQYYSVYVFHSADNGRTWDYLSQVSVTSEVFKEAGVGNFEGFSESSMTQMPDGSVVMLMRSGGTHPSYLVRSTDGCKTWSTPQRFDDCGVWPQILTLGCGVTVATYGRPRLLVRATGDASGVVWDEPIEIALSGSEKLDYWDRSCFYTYLLRLSATEALMVYSDLQYPNQSGQGYRRTILVRTITVVPTGE